MTTNKKKNKGSRKSKKKNAIDPLQKEPLIKKCNDDSTKLPVPVEEEKKEEKDSKLSDTEDQWEFV